MIRKLWLEMRAVFVVLVFAAIALTLEYTWVFKHASIMFYSEQNGFGAIMGPEEPTTSDIANFLKEHPQGKILSLVTSPESFFLGVDGIGRMLMPFLIVALCVGGILSERSSGTTSFSLSLPVHRSSWLWSKAAAVLVLAFAAASLSCILALGLAKWMGVDYGKEWLLTEPLLLTLGATGWIGVTMYIQSLLSGRFDAASESIITGATAAFLVILIEVFMPNSSLKDFANPYTALVDAALSTVHPAAWKPFLATGLAGIAGMLLSVRRFQRMDF